MRSIIEALKRLFNTLKGVPPRTVKGLLESNERQIAKAVVRSVDIKIGGSRVAYEELTEAEQEAIDTAVDLAIRFAHQYADHHDEYSSYQLEGSPEDHANEILDAVERSLYSHARSKAYDALFKDNDFLKQLVFAAIDEVHDKVS